MKYRHPFVITFIVGVLTATFINIYLQYIHMEYGTDLIKNRILPFGGLILSMIASAYCSISYKNKIAVTSPTPPLFLAFRMLFSKGILLPSLFFTLGAMFCSVVIGIIQLGPIVLRYLVTVLPLFILLYIFGIIGAVLGNIVFFNR